MVNKHIKRCLALSVKKLHVKISVRKITSMIIRHEGKCWHRCGEIGTLVHCWWEYKMLQAAVKTIAITQKLNIDLSCDPTVQLLGM